jgi:CBS domain-containing protein
MIDDRIYTDPMRTVSAAGRTEEFQVSGDALIAKLKELMHEGNVRRILIKNDEGEIMAEFPLTAGVVGAVLLPVWAAIGAIAALAANLTIVVVRKE